MSFYLSKKIAFLKNLKQKQFVWKNFYKNQTRNAMIAGHKQIFQLAIHVEVTFEGYTTQYLLYPFVFHLQSGQ